MATPAETIDDGRNVSGAQVALVLLGLIALLGVLWFLFLRGGDDTDEAVAPVPTPVASETVPGPSDPEESREGGNVETFEIFAPKDPFEPLIFAGGGGGAAPADGGPGSPGETAGEGDGGDTTPGAPGGNGGDSIGGHRVRLIDVFSEAGRDRAQIQVDGTVYTVDVGEIFADNFELISVSGGCATVLFGDDQFTICEGEEILK